MISVIVPVFNIELYLERCIRSIQNQTYNNIEIICTDDGSTDASPAILDEFAQNCADIIVLHKPNAGVTAARLAGAAIAQGENIGFCDGDDEIEPEMYERLLNNKIRYNADISHCGHKVVYTDGREEYFYNTGRLAQQDRTEGLKDLLSGSFEPGLCSKLFSKTLLHSLLRSGKMDTGIKYNEDLLMNYYLFRKADCSVFEDICPYLYLKRAGSACETDMKMYHVRDPLLVWKMIEEDCIGTEEENLAQLMHMSRYLNIYNNLLFRSKGKYQDEKNAIRSIIVKWKGEMSLLDRKRKIMVYAIKYCPDLYKLTYYFYTRKKRNK